MNPIVIKTFDDEHQQIDKAIAGLGRQLIALKHQRNSLSPIATFPYDALLTIFGWLKPLHEGSFETLISITHVCSHWRQMALGTPWLWDTIPPIYNKAACEEILSRSKGTPLGLIFREHCHTKLWLVEAPHDALEQIDKAIAGLGRQLIALKHQRNSLSPIATFPYDALLTIFGWLKPLHEGSFETLVSITHICSHWRQMALGAPWLWDTIPPIRNRAACEEILSRSNDTPLKVIFRERTGLWMGKAPHNALEALLSVARSRVKHIELRTRHQSTTWLIKAAAVLNETKLPQLQTLILGCDGKAHAEIYLNNCNLVLPPNLFKHFPSLLRLELHHCQFSWWNLFPLPNLTTLVIVQPDNSPSIPMLLTVLSRLPKFLTLQLTNCLPAEKGDATSGISPASSASDLGSGPGVIALSSTQNKLPLGSLRRLILKDVLPDMRPLFLSLGPAHSNLTVDLGVDKFNDIGYALLLGPLLRDYWQVKTLRAISLVRPEWHDSNRQRSILFHSTPEIIEETKVDFRIKIKIRRRWNEPNADEICWEIINGMQPTILTSNLWASTKTLHIDTPLSYDLLAKLSSSLPELATLSYIHQEEEVSSWALTDALSNPVLNAVGQEPPRILFPQVECFYFEAPETGPWSIEQKILQMLVLYAKRRHCLGIACRKFSFRKFAPLPGVFVEELKQYMDRVEANVEEEIEPRNEAGAIKDE